MPRYIDADAFQKRLQDFSNWCRDDRKQGVDFVLDCPLPNMPTADVQEVVRYKDCIHFWQREIMGDFDGKCTVRGWETDREDFCSYGMRLDEGEQDENSKTNTRINTNND